MSKSVVDIVGTLYIICPSCRQWEGTSYFELERYKDAQRKLKQGIKCRNTECSKRDNMVKYDLSFATELIRNDRRVIRKLELELEELRKL